MIPRNLKAFVTISSMTAWPWLFFLARDLVVFPLWSSLALRRNKQPHSWEPFCPHRNRCIPFYLSVSSKNTLFILHFFFPLVPSGCIIHGLCCCSMHIAWLMGGISIAKRTQGVSVIASFILRHDQYCLNSVKKAIYSPQAETRTFGAYSWKKRDGKDGNVYFSDFPYPCSSYSWWFLM